MVYLAGCKFCGKTNLVCHCSNCGRQIDHSNSKVVLKCSSDYENVCKDCHALLMVLVEERIKEIAVKERWVADVPKIPVACDLTEDKKNDLKNYGFWRMGTVLAFYVSSVYRPIFIHRPSYLDK